MSTVLCIDDQAPGLAIRKLLLEANGYEVLTATSGQEGLALLERHPVDLIILDYRMPEMDGEEVAARIKADHPGLPIIMLSGAVTEFPPRVEQLVDGFIIKGQPPLDLLALAAKLSGHQPQTRSTPASRADIMETSTDHVQRSRQHAATTRQKIEETRVRAGQERRHPKASDKESR